jgi:hypothetical protein
MNPYDPPAVQSVTDQRPSKWLRVLVRTVAGCVMLVAISHIAAVMLFGDTHKSALDSVGIVLLPAEFLIIVVCLILNRKLRNSKTDGMSH